MRLMLPRWVGRTSRAVIGCALLAVPSAAGSEPQQIRLSEKGTFSEKYFERPTVSGSLLVGVRWRGQEGRFDPHLVGLQVSPVTAGGTACVDIASKDGRYTAENLYRINKDLKGEALFEAETQYSQQLARYPLANIAVMVRKTASCDGVEAGQIVPAILAPAPEPGAAATPAENGRNLIMDINADADKVAVQLVVPGGPDLAADCQPAGEGVQISFSARCVIAVPQALPAGAYKLILTVRERFKRVETPFDLLLDNSP